MSKLITVLGSKDGVGTTTIVAKLAVHLKALIINLSYKGDVLHQFDAGVRRIADISSMISRSTNGMLLGYLGTGSKSASVIDSYEESVSTDFLNVALPALCKLYDHIIFDAGSIVTSEVATAMKFGSSVILVVTPEHSTLSEGRRKLDRFGRAFFKNVSVIVNRWDNSIQQDLVADKLCVQPIAWLPPVAYGEYAKEVSELSRQIANDQRDYNVDKVNWSEFFPVVDEPAIEKQSSPKTLSKESDQLKRLILEKLLNATELKGLEGHALYEKTETVVVQMLSQMDQPSVSKFDRDELIRDVIDEALGLGPLETLLKDGSISEIMVNSCEQIYVERSGKIELSPYRFTSNGQLLRVIERIVAPIGRRIDESSPMVDARLSDGSRVNIIIPPLSLRGPTITIRKFSETKLQMKDLTGFNALTEPMANFLRDAVVGRLNILVSGGTGSGKTTLLNVISSFIPSTERIVTIEDSAELQLGQDHVVSLESRPANIEGGGAVTIRDLVKNALRMRPDRIVIGECRGGEALDMLQAMNTGHDGSLTTIHANTPRDSIARLETLVMFAGAALPQRAIREQIASAINLIVQLSRMQDGSRKVVKISEVSGMEGDTITMQDLFVYKQKGVSSSGNVVGEFISTGFGSRYAERLTTKGVCV